jgi:predicted ATPase
MHIGFTGTHGTGKTTAVFELATALKKEGYDVSIKSNVARRCPLPINEKSTVRSQLWILATMMKEEIESTSQITISDRTLLDVLAYTKRLDKIVSETLQNFIRGYIKMTYDVVFYLSPMGEPEYLVDDGRRSTNRTFQHHIDVIIYDYIHKMNLDVKRMTTTEERLEFIKEQIEEE